MVGGGAVHVRGLQLHLAGGDGCVELHLSPVHHVEHQADADDDLKEDTVSRLRCGGGGGVLLASDSERITSSPAA